ncbi:ATP-dependent helicase [Candidatus Woesearchaeota archaeon]|nr:ATP-dependent helicase [Candidatus Woesearchaeota archaeon]
MISLIEKQYSEREIKAVLNPILKEWFFNTFKEFSIPQLYGVMEIHNKQNILISAPTGGTKTLTAFLSILNELLTLSEHNILEDRVYCVYISPLKALSRDIEKNLQEPLNEIKEIAKKYSKDIAIRIGLRTGDTSTNDKSAMLRKPPHILITTPESLSITLTSIKFRDLMRNVKYVIIDEVHALAENKRGVHLSLSMERLEQLNPGFTRIGLSATIAPLEEVARFLVGYENEKERNCKIVDVQFIKKMDLKVLSPVPDLININHRELHHSMYSLIDRLVQEHKTTLIFTNTRSATERVVHHLKEKFPKKYTENIGAHHGSLSKSLRHNIEDRLRNGELKVIVCSTSLELGIDIGYIDLVILLGSPKSIARGIQRIGRSGHRLHETSNGRIIVLDRDDLVENAVLLKNAIERKIDNIHIPKNCLDVLAQQIIGIAISDRINVEDLFKLVKKSYCYRNLERKQFDEIIDYLAGKYVSLEYRNIYAKIWHDEDNGMIGRRGKLGRVIFMTNVGTIPEESYVKVKIGEEPIGSIDEGFLERLRRGDVFVLGGQTYEFLYARGQTAQVRTSVNRPPTVPSWFSEMLPLSFDLALEVQKFRRLMEERFVHKRTKEEILRFVDEYLYVDKNGANAIYEYFKEQYSYLKEIPNDKKLLIEVYKDPERGTYFIFHSLFGRRVNDVLSRVIAYAVSRLQHRDVEFSINDNGFYIRGNKDVQVLRAFKMIKSNELRELAKLAIDKTEILKRRFRHCATRAFMILRTYKGRTKGVGRQQVASTILLNAVRQLNENFSILQEARREVLEDLMDIGNATIIIKAIENGEIMVKEVNTNLPSPFAFNIVLQGYSDVLKIEDKIEFLRRMHQKVMAKINT